MFGDLWWPLCRYNAPNVLGFTSKNPGVTNWVDIQICLVKTFSSRYSSKLQPLHQDYYSSNVCKVWRYLTFWYLFFDISKKNCYSIRDKNRETSPSKFWKTIKYSENDYVPIGKRRQNPFGNLLWHNKVTKKKSECAGLFENVPWAYSKNGLKLKNAN